MVFAASELSKFTTHPAKFIPTVFGGHVLVYESRSHPGHRREFAFKTRFTNQSGVSSCYYRCMSCRSMKKKVPAGPDGKPPQIPCIAVKNGFIVNDPDFPEANDHFCIPPTIEESKQREANGFAKAIVKGRPRQKPRVTKGAQKRQQPVMTQMQAYQAMANALRNNDPSSNVFDVSNVPNGFDLSLSAASASGFLEGSSSEFAEGLMGNSFLTNGSVPLESGEVKMEEEDSDGTMQANNLLASLISSEPALRSGITITHRNNVAPETNGNILVDECQEYRRSPESYNALVLNCLQNQADSRKRKSDTAVEALDRLLQEPADRYILNNWDLPENNGSARSTAELTCGLILSLARHIPQADSSMKKGRWNRKDFVGEEVYGKTLGVIGLGRIGVDVATRMQAFGMITIGYDPYVGQEEAMKNSVQWLALEQLWPLADYITVHVPLTPQTENLISAKTLAACRKGVKIINTARGGVVNEADLVESLTDGHVGGAAFDAYLQEPPVHRDLVEHPRVICSPHLSACTVEAQERMTKEITEDTVSATNGVGILTASNGSFLNAVSNEEKALWVRAVGVLAKVAVTLSTSAKTVCVKYPTEKPVKDARNCEYALRAAAAIGVLHAKGVLGVNLSCAEHMAKKEGFQIVVKPTLDNIITVNIGELSVSGYASQQGTFLTLFNASKVPVPLLATGTFAVNLSDGATFGELSESIKAKHCLEFGLNGGGRVALFSRLSSDETEELSRISSVICFD